MGGVAKPSTSAHRFFLEAPLSDPDGVSLLPLSPVDAHHLLVVLRAAPGDELIAVEPGGDAWRMRVAALGDKTVEAACIERVDTPSLCRLTLVQGMAKAGKVDLVIEKAVELNVEAVVPVLTKRSVVRLDSEKRAARGSRLRRVAMAAAKQSQRVSVPSVSDPVDFAEIVRLVPSFDVVLVLWEGASATAPGIGEALDEAGVTAESHVALVVGPEGGLATEEVYALEREGARSVTLGDTILRSETAGIVATALCVYELGGLGGRSRG